MPNSVSYEYKTTNSQTLQYVVDVINRQISLIPRDKVSRRLGLAGFLERCLRSDSDSGCIQTPVRCRLISALTKRPTSLRLFVCGHLIFITTADGPF